MSKFPIFESLVKTAHITSATKLLFMIKEYDTIINSTLLMKNEGLFIQKTGY